MVEQKEVLSHNARMFPKSGRKRCLGVKGRQRAQRGSGSRLQQPRRAVLQLGICVQHVAAPPIQPPQTQAGSVSKDHQGRELAHQHAEFQATCIKVSTSWTCRDTPRLLTCSGDKCCSCKAHGGQLQARLSGPGRAGVQSACLRFWLVKVGSCDCAALANASSMSTPGQKSALR